MTRLTLASFACALLLGCNERDLDARDLGALGDACEPFELGDDPPCEDALSCAPTNDGDAWICAQQITLRGRVTDALTGAPIEGALVTALDESGSPVSTAVATDAEGRYSLSVQGRRDADGAPAGDSRWTLFGTAAGYQTFPAGIRPAIPIAGSEAVASEDGYEATPAAAELALIPLEGAPEVSTLIGDVRASIPAGTMVVAESPEADAVYTIADADGHFVLFNVPRGRVTLRGYRRGLELTSVTLDVGEPEHGDVVLEEVTSDMGELGRVSGSLSIVDAPGDAQTSVVLVPSALWQHALERGPVPLGLRAPAPPGLPNVTGAFTLDGVPSGTYKVVAAFENDVLVRDPDASISGTDIVEIEVAQGQGLDMSTSFKVTAALAIIGPGADAPEVVATPPTLQWSDDSSETRYAVVVHDALGEVVWEDTEIPGVSGSSTVQVEYGGEALVPGMTYQFRVTSFKDGPQGSTALSRSEDLRGVFTYQP